MAESIAIHFGSVEWQEIRRTLDSACISVGPDRWEFPKDGEPCISVYPYDELLDEYENTQVDQVLIALDGFPTSILCIEMRRSQGNRAIDCAEEFAVLLLRRFEGIAADLVSTCWTLEQITNNATNPSGKFLDCYRTG